MRQQPRPLRSRSSAAQVKAKRPPPSDSVSAGADKPAETSAADALNGERTFGDLSLKYPSNWIIDEDTDKELRLASPNRDKVIVATRSEVPGSSALVSRDPDGYQSALETLAESAASSARDGGEPIDIRSCTIGEIEGIRFEYEGDVSSISYITSCVAFIANDAIYTVGIADTASELDAVDEAILDSVRVNKNTEQASSTSKKPSSLENKPNSDDGVSVSSSENDPENNAEETTSSSNSEDQAEPQEESSEPEFLSSQRDLMKQASLTYKKKVPNDVTGNWRLAFSNEDIPTADYAVAYYKEHFASDKEVHAIVNYNLGTITRLNYGSGLLFVDTYEYRSGEEADAKSMFEGEKLDEIVLNVETGEALQ